MLLGLQCKQCAIETCIVVTHVWDMHKSLSIASLSVSSQKKCIYISALTFLTIAKSKSSGSQQETLQKLVEEPYHVQRGIKRPRQSGNAAQKSMQRHVGASGAHLVQFLFDLVGHQTGSAIVLLSLGCKQQSIEPYDTIEEVKRSCLHWITLQSCLTGGGGTKPRAKVRL